MYLAGREILLRPREKEREKKVSTGLPSSGTATSLHLILGRLVRRLRKDVCLAVRTNLSGVSSDLCVAACFTGVSYPRFVSALCARQRRKPSSRISIFAPTADVPRRYYSVSRFVPLDSFFHRARARRERNREKRTRRVRSFSFVSAYNEREVESGEGGERRWTRGRKCRVISRDIYLLSVPIYITDG